MFTILLCSFINPIAEHAFILKAISSFYIISKNTEQPFFEKIDPKDDED